MPSRRRVFRNGAIKAIGIADHAAGLIVTEVRHGVDTAVIAVAIREAVLTGTGTEAGTEEDTAVEETAPVLALVLVLALVAATMEADGVITAVAANGNVTGTPCWGASLMTGTAGHAGTQAVLPVGAGAATRQIGASSEAAGHDVSVSNSLTYTSQNGQAERLPVLALPAPEAWDNRARSLERLFTLETMLSFQRYGDGK